MIEVKDIWGDIENAGLAEYVSKYEIWMKEKDFKKMRKGNDLVVYITADKYVIPLLFLLFVIFIGSIFSIIFQKRYVWGSIVLIIDILFIQEMLFKRYTGYTYIFKNGILNGIPFKKITKRFGVRYTFLEYQNIKEIRVTDDEKYPRLISVLIKTKDGKYWPYHVNYTGISLPKKHPKTEAIVSYLRKISEERNILFIDNRAYSG